jgi:hypothetical protein
MSSSFLNWLKACLFLTVFFVGCSDADNDWSLCRAVDQGGFSVRMPAESGSQNGTLVLGKDTIVSHIDILADSGITYASSWFEIPPQYAGLSEGAVLDSIWPLIVNRVKKKILVIGSSGQIGTELVEGLRARFGNENVVASDIKEPQVKQDGPFAMVDAMDRRGIERIIEKHGINEVYLLAALLSATAEKDPAFAWKLNMESLFIVLELAREGRLKNGLLAQQHRRVRAHHAEGWHAAAHHRRAQHRVWHQQAGR